MSLECRHTKLSHSMLIITFINEIRNNALAFISELGADLLWFTYFSFVMLKNHRQFFSMEMNQQNLWVNRARCMIFSVDPSVKIYLSVMWIFCNVQFSGMEKILQAHLKINRFLMCAKESTEIPDFVMLISETCESIELLWLMAVWQLCYCLE